MDNFFNYVKRFDNNFKTRIVGASFSEIAQLETLLGRPLPDYYKQFLLYMGHSDRELSLAYQGSTDIAEVIKYYEFLVKYGEEEEWPPPADCILIGTGDVSVGDICLQMDQSEEPRVVFAMEGDMIGLYAETLEKLLFRNAFVKYRLRLLPKSGVYRSGPLERVFDPARSVAVKLNFVLQWFSDGAGICGERADAAILIEQYQETGIWICIAAQDKREVERIGNVFVNQLGVSFYR